MSGEGGGGFLSRWSRRKRAAAEEAAEPSPEAAPDPGPPGTALPLAQPAPAAGPPADGSLPAAPGDGQRAAPGDGQRAAPGCPIPGVGEIDPASLPPVETLTAESDFGLFLRPGVPAGLRNAALRRMWSLDPAIRDYIGPVDYQWDFNTPGGLPFGFANELGGEVKKLLAQAIGQRDEEEEEAAAPEGAPDSAPEGAPDAAPDAAAGTAGDPRGEAAPDAEPEEAAPEPPALLAEDRAPPPPAQQPAPVPSARRRHGGALPA